jgi:Kazal-type serine protease inhibitor domain
MLLKSIMKTSAWRCVALAVAVPFALSAVLTATPAAAVSGAKCGGFAGMTCGNNEFCNKPTGACLFPDAEGTCAVVPQLCPMVVLPVCGCDGKTYTNDCVRERARVTKAHDGKCWETP